MKTGILILVIIQRLIVISAVDIHLTLNGPTDVERGTVVILICTVYNAVNLEDEVIFSTFHLNLSLTQKLDHCYFNKVKGYHYVCGEGTDETLAEIKIYKLTIFEISYASDTWICKLGRNRTESSKHRIAIQDFYFILKMSSEDNGQFNLTCIVNNAINMINKVKFFASNIEHAVFFQNYSRCNSSIITKRAFKTVCGADTYINWSNVKTYILTFTQMVMVEENWQCLVRPELRSNIITLRNKGLSTSGYKNDTVSLIYSRKYSNDTDSISNPYLTLAIVVVAIVDVGLITTLIVYCRVIFKKRQDPEKSSTPLNERDTNDVSGVENPLCEMEEISYANKGFSEEIRN